MPKPRCPPPEGLPHSRGAGGPSVGLGTGGLLWQTQGSCPAPAAPRGRQDLAQQRYPAPGCGSPWPPMPALPSTHAAPLPQKERAWPQHQVHPDRMETPRLASGCSRPPWPPEVEAGASAPRQGGLEMLLQVHQSHREYCQHLQRRLVQIHVSGKEDFFLGQLPKTRGKQSGLYNPIRKGQKTVQKQETMRNTRSSYFLFFF